MKTQLLFLSTLLLLIAFTSQKKTYSKVNECRSELSIDNFSQFEEHLKERCGTRGKKGDKQSDVYRSKKCQTVRDEKPDADLEWSDSYGVSYHSCWQLCQNEIDEEYKKDFEKYFFKCDANINYLSLAFLAVLMAFVLL
ncbi:hypothetical protein PPERSA_05311 [Pseudocohnilembus persalinus]|uniref:Transmembrane protein n=1 Tax=Pseudocohnilembus persalinus TaxID=266149 RepID=A0A0V0R5Z1_PSEPJ|nr:hypothetical protein PPERSA_05311 [Pseudocohnilembus persalinus]|eukprot:KRX09919.1 hypothetical protein PPERSA_05311 [Pseudocohnilembus persalinus]